MKRLIDILRKIRSYCIFLCALGMVLVGISNFQALEEKRQWPMFEATIVTSAAKPSDSDSSKRQLDFRYTYQVKGRTFSSGRVYASSFREKVEYASEVDEVIGRFPVGAKATGVFNPKRPSESYLDVSPSVIDYVLPVCGVSGMIVFGAWVYAKRKKKTARTNT